MEVGAGRVDVEEVAALAVLPLTVADQPITWDQYAALGEDARAEYIDGRLVVSPSPTRRHQQAVHRLVAALSAALPDDLAVTAGWSWKPGADEFIPDVMVHERTDESVRFTGLPVLLVEVLSTNRADDLVVKTGRYASHGVANYWVADPNEPSLSAFELTGERLYRRAAYLVAGDIARLTFGPGQPDVDVDALFAD